MKSDLQFPVGNFVALFGFAVGMAFVEAAVVVYLRELYYPGGFSFPLKTLPTDLAIVEISREVATLLMLATVGWLSARNFFSRFAGFAMAFGVWDIFYYIFLKLTLNWPASLMEWDILFLIPLPWVGPVIAPVLVSISMIAAGILIWHRNSRNDLLKPTRWHWLLELLAGFIIIGSFLTNINAVLNQTMPEPFHWEIFLSGLVLGIVVFVHCLKWQQKKD